MGEPSSRTQPDLAGAENPFEEPNSEEESGPP